MPSVKFDEISIADISCSDVFYKQVGLYDLFKSGEISNVYQMKINSKTFDFISKTIQKNWKKCPFTKHTSAKYAKQAIMFDWYNYSPVCCEDVPEWTIQYGEV